MVNMNRYKEPAVYALKHGGGFFYVGRTSSNALNRLWQHRARARGGHSAPVYEKMREVGVYEVEFEVLHYLSEEDDPREVEAGWISKLLSEGHELANQMGRDGVPDSFSESAKEKLSNSRRGRSTWIKGKTGEEAGWTEERKRAQGEAVLARRVPKHGTSNERIKYGCECEVCRDWEEMLKEAKAQKSASAKIRTHGTVQCYKRGLCRCEDCSRAYRDYKRSLPKRQ